VPAVLDAIKAELNRELRAIIVECWIERLCAETPPNDVQKRY
jgi:hypothetical protein